MYNKRKNLVALGCPLLLANRNDNSNGKKK